MKLIFQFLLILLIPWLLRGQSVTLPEILTKIESLPEIQRQTAANELLQSYQGAIPYVRGDNAVFLYTGLADRVSVPGDFNGWSRTADPMSNIKGTDLWYLYKTFDHAARLDYKICVDEEEWILDPRNPDQMMGGFGPNSELKMPAYAPSPDYADRPDVTKGRLHEKIMTVDSTGRQYRLQIYLPADYKEDSSMYPVIYFNDGSDYLNFGEARAVLDNLIFDGDIPPALAIFIDPHDRMLEYGGEATGDYMHFILAKVIPWVESTYPNAGSDKDQRVMVGTSLGGNITTLISYRNAHVFGKAGIHSPAFGYKDGKALKLLKSVKSSPVSGYFVIGTYEGWDLQKRQNLRELISSPAINGKLVLAPQGHNWGLWRDTLGNMLRYLFNVKH